MSGPRPSRRRAAPLRFRDESAPSEGEAASGLGARSRVRRRETSLPGTQTAMAATEGPGERGSRMAEAAQPSATLVAPAETPASADVQQPGTSTSQQPPAVQGDALDSGYSHLSEEEDAQMVNGALGHSVTLPCSITFPDNLSVREIHVLWFRNFTDKLLDCTLREGSPPVCGKSHDSSRVQLGHSFFGNADLQLSSLQESDAGPYQCWMLLADTYRRKYFFLRLDGESNNASGRNRFPLHAFDSWGELSPWDILFISGWPVALLLVVIFLSQKIFKKYGKRRPGII